MATLYGIVLAAIFVVVVFSFTRNTQAVEVIELRSQLRHIEN